jgi:signal transduction histidine kinase
MNSQSSTSFVGNYSSCLRLFLFIFAAWVNSSFAFTPRFIDSIKTCLASTNDPKEKIKLLYHLSYQYGSINPRISISYADQILSLAFKNGSASAKIRGYNAKTHAYKILGILDSALLFAVSEYRYACEIRDSTHIAVAKANMGECKRAMGNYLDALQDYLDAYMYLQHQNGYNYRIHFHLGEIYIKTGQWDKVIEHARLGYRKSMQFGEPYIAHTLQINMARYYLHYNKFDSAQAVLDMVISPLTSQSDKVSLAMAYNTQAELYLLLNKPGLAFEYFAKENEIYKTLMDLSGIYLSEINCAYSLALQNNNVNRSIIKSLLTLAMQAEDKLKLNKEALGEGLGRMAKTYEIIHEWQMALEAYRRFEQIEDSLTGAAKMYAFNKLESKYDNLIRESEISQLKQSNLLSKSQIRFRNTLIISISLMMIMVFIILKNKNQRKILKLKMDKELSILVTEDRERRRFSEDLHDDLGFGLSKIGFLCGQLLKQKDIDNFQKVKVEGIKAMTDNLVSNMRDMIWILNADNLQFMDLISRIREYASDFLDDYDVNIQFDLPEISEEFKINKDAHRQILLVLKESLNNVLKHSKSTNIKILVEINNDKFSLIIMDDGVGFGQSAKAGNGLLNMQKRMNRIGGALDICSSLNHGTAIKAALPLGLLRA